MAPPPPPSLSASDVRSTDFQTSRDISASHAITQLIDTENDFTFPTFNLAGTVDHPSAGAASGASGVSSAGGVPAGAGAGVSAGASADALAGPSSSEVLERQPQTAKGYEWNERYMSLNLRGNDGYASLSMEPDGKGYLGE